MGRTLHYKVFDTDRHYADARKEIRIAQELLLFRYTWPCEQPTLRDLDGRGRRDLVDLGVYPRSGPFPIADGFTKVAGDEWSAVLLTRFMTWVSRRLPEATVALHDEGDYLTAGYHVLRNGAVTLDEERLDEHRQYLVERRLDVYLARQRDAVEQFKHDVIHLPIPARDYADRPEIVALGIPADVLGQMTLDEVADRLTFPWTTEGLTAA
jgi:hypothetical protein